MSKKDAGVCIGLCKKRSHASDYDVVFYSSVVLKELCCKRRK